MSKEGFGKTDRLGLYLGTFIAIPFVAGMISINGERISNIQRTLESIIPEIQEPENVFGGEAPERFYEINGERVYLEIDGVPVEQYVQSLDR